MSLNYRLFPDRLCPLFCTVVREENDLDHWHFDMMGQTMRNGVGAITAKFGWKCYAVGL
ncbi:MAG TPA: hypothetical protein V6D37_17650 [Candidatus Sericytochromatia bacterium]